MFDLSNFKRVEIVFKCKTEANFGLKFKTFGA